MKRFPAIDDWIDQFLRDYAENAARKQRGEPAAPVFYRDVGGKVQRSSISTSSAWCSAQKEPVRR
jgi:hypothetical protein